MYSDKQKAKALRLYHRIGSATQTVRQLGYPSREHLYSWIHEEGKGEKHRKTASAFNTKEHPRNPPTELKIDVLKRCFEDGESVKSVSAEIGYSRASIYTWRKRYLQGGAVSLMNTKNITPDELPDNDGKISYEEVENLRKQMYELQMEVDILKGKSALPFQMKYRETFIERIPGSFFLRISANLPLLQAKYICHRRLTVLMGCWSHGVSASIQMLIW